MILVIENIEFRHFNNIDVKLSYDSIASAFSANVFFDPDNETHRHIFRPLEYRQCKIFTDDMKLLLTGTFISHGFESSSVANWAKISGYSKTGVLEDCEIPLQCYPLQTNSLSVVEICHRICKPFGIAVAVDPDVHTEANKKIVKSTASDDQKAREYLANICASRLIVLTHTEKGELYLTRAKTSKNPVYAFAGKPTKGVTMSLGTNGQAMHSSIGAIRQAGKRQGNATIGQSVISNPYVQIFRPAVKRQKSGNNTDDTASTARNILSDELRSITLSVEMEGFYLNDTFVQPGQIVSVQNPEVYLYKSSLWFIESVTYKQDSVSTGCTLTLQLPEVYNNHTPKNIFL